MATFNSAVELAEAILNKDARIKKGEFFWAVGLGMAIGQMDGKPSNDPAALLMTAETLDAMEKGEGYEERADALKKEAAKYGVDLDVS